MSQDANEDLIEATIRRVQEAKAARAARQSQDQLADDEAPSADSQAAIASRAELHAVPGVDTAPDDDAIEATIRRVAEAKAARESTTVAREDDPSKTAVRRATESRAAREPTPTADEDPIEATIRRVAEQKAARDAETSLDEASAFAEPVAFEGGDDAIEATIRRVAAQKAAREAEPAVDDAPPYQEDVEEPMPAPRPFVARAPVAPSALAPAAHVERETEASWEDTRQRLEQGLSQTNREVRELASRFDALVPLLERLAAASEPPSIQRPHAARPQPVQSDDAWDDAPQLPQVPFGTAPRPAILRDPSPQTATAQHLIEEYDDEPDEVEIRPAQAAPIESKRGFELLPRTYRITVEDKRRGVDLVPLHRALLGMDGMRDMSLLSYSNGTAIISLETTEAIDPDALAGAVSRAMSRPAKVEVHNEQTMVVKLQEE